MEEQYFPTVVQVLAGENRSVYVYFSDGSIRLYDVQPLIEGGNVFSALEDDTFFHHCMTVMNGTLAWDRSGHYDPTDCIDIDPFTIYEESALVSDPLKNIG